MNDASNVPLLLLSKISAEIKMSVKLHDSEDLDPLDVFPFPNKQLLTSNGTFFLYTLSITYKSAILTV